MTRLRPQTRSTGFAMMPWAPLDEMKKYNRSKMNVRVVFWRLSER